MWRWRRRRGGPAGPPRPPRGGTTLADLEQGAEAVVRGVIAGYAVARRLADMGLTPGTVVRVVRKNALMGPIEVEVRGTRLLLGRGVASKVLVEPKMGPPSPLGP